MKVDSSTPIMRVVALTENNPYPRDVRVRPHMEALAGNGYQVSVICPRDENQRWTEEINGVHVYRFPAFFIGKNAVGYILEFFWATFILTALTIWVWFRHGMDVLHIYNPPDSLFIAGLLPKMVGKKIICDLREITPELFQSKFRRGSPFLYKILILLEYLLCHLGDHILVVNESCLKLIQARERIAPEHLTIVRQAPDIARVRQTEPDPVLRSRAQTIIAFMGSIASQDGIDHLLYALHHLDHRFGYSDWYCALIGPADDLKGLKALSAELGLSDRTWFPGYLPMEKWIPILSTADICVEPCPSSPLNNIATMQKIMDYMALCKPTVAYDLPEHHFTAGEAALYAIKDDPIDLARQIARLVDDLPLRSKLGGIGRRRMEQSFNWSLQKERLLGIYKDLAGLRR